MAGTAHSAIRSASVAESTHGTIPATPGFTTSVDLIDMKSTAQVFKSASLVVGGAIDGVGITAVPITGTMAGNMIYGNLDNWLAGLLQGTWATNVLKNGTTRTTLAVENTFPAGQGGTSTMMRYRGVEAIGGKLTLGSKADIQYSLDLIGMGFTAGTTTAITGATYSDPAEKVPLTSGMDVGAITMVGYTPGGIQSADIDFVFDGRNPQDVLGSLDTVGTTLGAFQPTISVKALIDTSFAAIHAAAQAAHSTFAVTFPIGSVSGSKYTLAFPACSFGGTDLDLSGQEPLQTIELIPQYDSSSSAVLTVTRAVA